MNALEFRNTSPSLTVQIVETIAEHDGVDETELPPLSDVIDPDALESLFVADTDSTGQEMVQVRFSYCGYTVVVRNDGSITLE